MTPRDFLDLLLVVLWWFSMGAWANAARRASHFQGEAMRWRKLFIDAAKQTMTPRTRLFTKRDDES